MTPETIAALVNMGSAGAVILVVILFLKNNKERDQQWRDFFTVLNSTNKDDILALADAMQKMTASLDKHETTVNEQVVKRLERIEDAVKQPTRATKGPTR